MIRVETEGKALRLVLDAPKANVLDAAMISALQGALEQVTPSTRLIVIEGEGAHFSFGASVAEHQREQAPAMLATFHQLFRSLAACAVPTVAVVRGQCLGGGLELASWCTWIVASPEARFGQPEVQLSVFPPMASVLLPWRIGGGAALDLCVGGARIDASEALRLGLVSAVSEDPEGWWRARLKTLERSSAVGLRYAERAARITLMAQLDTHLGALERLYLDELMATHDANEGIAAFLNKRPPEYVDA